MNQKTFIETILRDRTPDRYGWVTCTIGRYRFRTDGKQWTALTLTGNHVITRLAVIIAEWEKQPTA